MPGSRRKRRGGRGRGSAKDGERGDECDHRQRAGEVDAAEGGVTWEAASVALSSEAEIGPSGESGFGFNPKDLLEETRRSTSQSGIVRKCKMLWRREMRWTGSRTMRC